MLYIQMLVVFVFSFAATLEEALKNNFLHQFLEKKFATTKRDQIHRKIATAILK